MLQDNKHVPQHCETNVT